MKLHLPHRLQAAVMAAIASVSFSTVSSATLAAGTFAFFAGQASAEDLATDSVLTRLPDGAEQVEPGALVVSETGAEQLETPESAALSASLDPASSSEFVTAEGLAAIEAGKSVDVSVTAPSAAAVAGSLDLAPQQDNSYYSGTTATSTTASSGSAVSAPSVGGGAGAVSVGGASGSTGSITRPVVMKTAAAANTLAVNVDNVSSTVSDSVNQEAEEWEDIVRMEGSSLSQPAPLALVDANTTYTEEVISATGTYTLTPEGATWYKHNGDGGNQQTSTYNINGGSYDIKLSTQQKENQNLGFITANSLVLSSVDGNSRFKIVGGTSLNLTDGLSLDGAQLWVESDWVYNGDISLKNSNFTGDGDQLENAAMRINANLSLGGAVTLAGDSRITWQSSNSTTVNMTGSLSGSGNLLLSSYGGNSGTLRLSGSITGYNGTIQTTETPIAFNMGPVSIDAASNVTVSGSGSFAITGTVKNAGTLTLNKDFTLEGLDNSSKWIAKTQGMENGYGKDVTRYIIQNTGTTGTLAGTYALPVVEGYELVRGDDGITFTSATFGTTYTVFNDETFNSSSATSKLKDASEISIESGATATLNGKTNNSAGVMRGTVIVRGGGKLSTTVGDTLGWSGDNFVSTLTVERGGVVDIHAEANETFGGTLNLNGKLTGVAGSMFDFLDNSTLVVAAGEHAVVDTTTLRLRRNDRTFTVNSGATLDIASDITKPEGNGVLIKNGSGVMSLSGNVNLAELRSYGSGTTEVVDGGALVLSSKLQVSESGGNGGFTLLSGSVKASHLELWRQAATDFIAGSVEFTSASAIVFQHSDGVNKSTTNFGRSASGDLSAAGDMVLKATSGNWSITPGNGGIVNVGNVTINAANSHSITLEGAKLYGSIVNNSQLVLASATVESGQSAAIGGSGMTTLTNAITNNGTLSLSGNINMHAEIPGNKYSEGDHGYLDITEDVNITVVSGTGSTTVQAGTNWYVNDVLATGATFHDGTLTVNSLGGTVWYTQGHGFKFVESDTKTTGIDVAGREAGVTVATGANLAQLRDGIRVDGVAAGLTIQEGVRVASTLVNLEGSDSSLTLGGAGTYELQPGVRQLPTSVSLGNGWEGTVAISNVAFADGMGNALNALRNVNSWVEAKGLSGWSNSCIINANLVLVNGDNGWAYKQDNGNNGQTLTFAGQIKGDGKMGRSEGRGSTYTYAFTNDISGWTGTFESRSLEAHSTTFLVQDAAIVINAVLDNKENVMNVDVRNAATFNKDIKNATKLTLGSNASATMAGSCAAYQLGGVEMSDGSSLAIKGAVASAAAKYIEIKDAVAATITLAHDMAVSAGGSSDAKAGALLNWGATKTSTIRSENAADVKTLTVDKLELANRDTRLNLENVNVVVTGAATAGEIRSDRSVNNGVLTVGSGASLALNGTTNWNNQAPKYVDLTLSGGSATVAGSSNVFHDITVTNDGTLDLVKAASGRALTLTNGTIAISGERYLSLESMSVTSGVIDVSGLAGSLVPAGEAASVVLVSTSNGISGWENLRLEGVADTWQNAVLRQDEANNLVLTFDAPPAPVSDGQLGKVLFMGDSITHGYWDMTYRWQVFKALVDNGAEFELTGPKSGYTSGKLPSSSTNPDYGSLYLGTAFVNEHYAQSSGRSGQMLDGSNGYGYTVDYVGNNYDVKTGTLMIGTNDLLSDSGFTYDNFNTKMQGLLGGTVSHSTDGVDAVWRWEKGAELGGNMRTILDEMNLTEGDTFYVLSIPVWGVHDNNNADTIHAAVAGYNTLLQQWVAEYDKISDASIKYVNVNKGLMDVTSSTPFLGNKAFFNNGKDGLHPSDQGALIIAGNLLQAMGVSGRNAGLERAAAAAEGWIAADSKAISFTAGSVSQTFASGQFHVANGYSVDFSAVFGNGATGSWLDADKDRPTSGVAKRTSFGTLGDSLNIKIGDGTNTGTLKLAEGYITWNGGNGDMVLYSRDNQVQTDSLRIAYRDADSANNILGGYYVWMGDMLIGQGLAATAGSFNGIELGITGTQSVGGSIYNLSWSDTAYAPTSVLFHKALEPLGDHDNPVKQGTDSSISWTTMEVDEYFTLESGSSQKKNLYKVMTHSIGDNYTGAAHADYTGTIGIRYNGTGDMDAKRGVLAVWEATVDGNVYVQLDSPDTVYDTWTTTAAQKASLVATWKGNITGSYTAVINGGTFNHAIYGGAHTTSAGTGSIGGGSNIFINDGTLISNVFGGNYAAAGSIAEGTHVTITGGTIKGNVYGGGANGSITGGTYVTITGGIIGGDVNGGGTGGSIEGETHVTVDGYRPLIKGGITADRVTVKNVEDTDFNDCFDTYSGTITGNKTITLENYTVKEMQAALVTQGLVFAGGTHTKVSKLTLTACTITADSTSTGILAGNITTGNTITYSGNLYLEDSITFTLAAGGSLETLAGGYSDGADGYMGTYQVVMKRADDAPAYSSLHAESTGGLLTDANTATFVGVGDSLQGSVFMYDAASGNLLASAGAGTVYYLNTQDAGYTYDSGDTRTTGFVLNGAGSSLIMQRDASSLTESVGKIVVNAEANITLAEGVVLNSSDLSYGEGGSISLKGAGTYKLASTGLDGEHFSALSTNGWGGVIDATGLNLGEKNGDHQRDANTIRLLNLLTATNITGGEVKLKEVTDGALTLQLGKDNDPYSSGDYTFAATKFTTGTAGNLRISDYGRTRKWTVGRGTELAIGGQLWMDHLQTLSIEEGGSVSAGAKLRLGHESKANSSKLTMTGGSLKVQSIETYSANNQSSDINISGGTVEFTGSGSILTVNGSSTVKIGMSNDTTPVSTPVSLVADSNNWTLAHGGMMLGNIATGGSQTITLGATGKETQLYGLIQNSGSLVLAGTMNVMKVADESASGEGIIYSHGNNGFILSGARSVYTLVSNQADAANVSATGVTWQVNGTAHSDAVFENGILYVGGGRESTVYHVRDASDPVVYMSSDPELADASTLLLEGGKLTMTQAMQGSTTIQVAAAAGSNGTLAVNEGVTVTQAAFGTIGGDFDLEGTVEINLGNNSGLQASSKGEALMQHAQGGTLRLTAGGTAYYTVSAGAKGGTGVLSSALTTSNVIALGGDWDLRSFGMVSLEGGKAMVFRMDGGGRTVHYKQLNVDGTGTLGTYGTNAGNQGTFIIDTLSGSGELVLQAQAFNGNAGRHGIFHLGGGDAENNTFKGTITVKPVESDTKGDRWATLVLDDATVAQHAIISFADSGDAALAINADTKVDGINDATTTGSRYIYSGSTDGAFVTNSNSGTFHTLAIDADETFSTAAKLGSELNIVKDGTGKQSFTGDISSYNGNVTVNDGTLVFSHPGGTQASAELHLTGIAGAGGKLESANAVEVNVGADEIYTYAGDLDLALLKKTGEGKQMFTSVVEITRANLFEVDSGTLTLSGGSVFDKPIYNLNGLVQLGGEVNILMDPDRVPGSGAISYSEGDNGFMRQSAQYTLVFRADDGARAEAMDDVVWMVDGTERTDAKFDNGVLTIGTDDDKTVYYVNTGTVAYSQTEGDIAEARNVLLHGGKLVLGCDLNEGTTISVADKEGSALQISNTTLANTDFLSVGGDFNLQGNVSVNINSLNDLHSSGTGLLTHAKGGSLTLTAPGIGYYNVAMHSTGATGTLVSNLGNMNVLRLSGDMDMTSFEKVSVGDGKALLFAMNGSGHTVSMGTLEATGNSSLGTFGTYTSHQGTYNVANLQGSGNLLLTGGSGTGTKHNVFNLGGGDGENSFSGTISVQPVNPNNGGGAAASLVLRDETVAKDAVVSLQTGPSRTAALGVEAATAKVGGITDSNNGGAAYIFGGADDASRDAANSFRSQKTGDTAAHTLVLTNTADRNLTTGATVTGDLNLVMDGPGSQSFKGDVSNFDGTITVKQGSLSFYGNSALTSTATTVEGGVLRVANTGDVNLGSLTLSGGQMDLATSVNVGSLNTSGGTLTFAGENMLTSTGAITIGSGTVIDLANISHRRDLANVEIVLGTGAEGSSVGNVSFINQTNADATYTLSMNERNQLVLSITQTVSDWPTYGTSAKDTLVRYTYKKGDDSVVLYDNECTDKEGITHADHKFSFDKADGGIVEFNTGNGGELNVTSDAVNSGVNVNKDTTFVVEDGATVNLGYRIDGTGNITKEGAGTLATLINENVFGGNISYSGSVYVMEGTLIANKKSVLGAADNAVVVVDKDATLVLQHDRVPEGSQGAKSAQIRIPEGMAEKGAERTVSIDSGNESDASLSNVHISLEGIRPYDDRDDGRASIDAYQVFFKDLTMSENPLKVTMADIVGTLVDFDGHAIVDNSTIHTDSTFTVYSSDFTGRTPAHCEVVNHSSIYLDGKYEGYGIAQNMSVDSTSRVNMNREGLSDAFVIVGENKLGVASVSNGGLADRVHDAENKTIKYTSTQLDGLTLGASWFDQGESLDINLEDMDLPESLLGYSFTLTLTHFDSSVVFEDLDRSFYDAETGYWNLDQANLSLYIPQYDGTEWEHLVAHAQGKFDEETGHTVIVFSNFEPAPEPTTGTLGLLALAALCARRRRQK